MAGAGVAGKALEDKTNQTLHNSFTSSFGGNDWNVNIGTGTQTNQTDRSSSPLGSGVGSILNNPVLLLALCAAAYYLLKRK